MAEPSASPHEIVLRLRPWMLIALIAVAHILFCALVNPFGEGFRDWSGYLILGAWYAQPLMFGLWLALGTGSFSTRFQSTVLAFALLLLASKVTLASDNWLDPEDLPLRVAMFLVTASIMLVVRWWAGWRVARGIDGEMNPSGPLRFSIKSMLVWTTFWAGLLSAGRSRFSPQYKYWRSSSLPIETRSLCFCLYRAEAR